MRRTQRQTSGFTLVEMLIIAPLVILVISGFVGLMVSMVRDIVLSRDENTMAFQSQDALNRIEQDVRLSTQFLTTSGTLPSPQGSDSNYTGTAAFSNASNTLILNGLATDSNPTDPTRWLVYYDNQPNPCGSAETNNKIFTIKIMYFINNGSLWRRVYVPSWNLNTTTPDANTVCTFSSSFYPWQRNTCSPGYTSSQCQTNDEQLMQNISSLTVQYFSNPGSTTDLGAANANNAQTIGVTINGQQNTGGRTFTKSVSLRVTRLNSLSTN